VRITRVSSSGIPQVSGDLPHGKELSRLITAAVINREFCNLLLANPAMAMATGYNGEPFDLATEEQELILSIRATSLADFAKQLTKNGNGNGYDHNYNGNGHGHSRSREGYVGASG
jgi:hypothetical protein